MTSHFSQPQNSQPSSQQHTPGNSSMPATNTYSRLKSGDTIEINGDPLQLVVISGDQTAFKPPADLTANEVRSYQSALELLRQSAQTVSKVSDRLHDPEDGRTLKGVDILTSNLPAMTAEFSQKIRGYLIGLLKEGSTVHHTRSCVLVPPCSKAEFSAAIAALPTDARTAIDWNAWLDHIYDPVPRATEGHYLFASPEDKARFDTLLGSSYADNAAELTTLFSKALTGPLSSDEWRKYDDLSQSLIDEQKKLLEPVLEKDEAARGMCTRVRISVNPAGTISLATTHYTEDFVIELTELSRQLSAAAAALPPRAAELRSVLEAQAAWCVDTKRDPNWGQSLPVWIAANDGTGLLDVNVTCEEKTSRIGAKSVMHLVAAQHTEPPASVQTAWQAVCAGGATSNVNTLLLNILHVGGFASTYTIAGEKLPDPGGQPQYKSMTFSNTTQAVMVRAPAPAIAAATGLAPAVVDSYILVPILTVALHEYGHTLGDHASFLGEHSGSVEETNAQASCVYLAARHAPGDLVASAHLECCWMPIRRIRQGPTEQHSRSDIALFEEYLQSGGIRIADNGGKPVVEVVDQQAIIDTAFKTAIKMRLWEKGIPTRLHDQFLEPLDLSGEAQDRRITQTAIDFMAAQPDQAALKAETLREVNAYFANDRMLAIGAKAAPVIAHMPTAQPLSVMLTDERLARLVE